MGAILGEFVPGWTGEATAGPPAALRVNQAMDRYASGDAEAFSELYDLLSPRLYAFLLRQTKNAVRAEDLLQQTLLQIHCARASYSTGADVVPWAFAIARRLVIDGYRKSRREVIGVDTRERERVSADRPDEMAEARQAMGQVEEALAALPETQRIAFELIKCDGLSLQEAAQVLGTSVSAVKLRAHRTYEALRAVLNDDGTKRKRASR
jgi:RNA polymerase sigma-70 factor (ECF subfamily)